jgi:chromosome partitioning protein
VITIAIATHKGGTGKTVTSMALAAALARSGNATLLVDLDPQGHSTLGLGVDVGPKQATLRELLAEPPRPIADVVVRTTVPHLSIVPSNIRVERPAQALYMRPRREGVLRRALAQLQPAPTFVVIDCPPSLGPLTENGIAAANWILVPCQMEARAVDGLVDLLELVAILKGEAFADWRIVYTKIDTRKTVTNAAVQAALEPYKAQTLETTIPQSEPLNQAQIERADIYSYAPDSKGAIAYRTLAHEVIAVLARIGTERGDVTRTSLQERA